MPQELTWPVLARAIEDADGDFVDHDDLRRAIAAVPDLAERAASAAADSDYRWESPELFLGNAVAHWSRSWTVERNPYASRFERESDEARGYRYRLPVESVEVAR